MVIGARGSSVGAHEAGPGLVLVLWAAELVVRAIAVLAGPPGVGKPAEVVRGRLEGGVGGRRGDMVSRIQPFSLVTRVYTPGFLA